MAARWIAATRWRSSAIRPACSAICANAPSRSRLRNIPRFGMRPVRQRVWSPRPGRRSLCQRRATRERWRHYREIQPPQSRPRNPPRSLLRPRWEASCRRRRSHRHCRGALRRRRRSRRHCGGALRYRRRSRRHCVIQPPQSRPRNPPRSLLRPRWRASRRCRHAGPLRCALRRRRMRPHHLERARRATVSADTCDGELFG
jgi:hypothetical protein